MINNLSKLITLHCTIVIPWESGLALHFFRDPRATRIVRVPYYPEIHIFFLHIIILK